MKQSFELFVEVFNVFQYAITSRFAFQMRKYQDKEKKLQFKGSIFVQFKTLELARSFLETESVKYEGTELIKKWS